MQSHTVGFVGGGRITATFLQALGGRGLALDRVTVSDASPEVLSKLSARFPAIATTAVTVRPQPASASSWRFTRPPSRLSFPRSHPA
jgi:pyrroline-5-carboxylate reductase